MSISKSKFVGYYPMPNGLTLRLEMLLDKGPDKSCLIVQYGPETATQEQFFALRHTAAFEAAMQQFSDDYRQFLKQHYPDHYARATA
jgi:hypothetical protein